jgi:hypothetical protein
MTARNSSSAPRWVWLSMLLIGGGWVLFFCVASGLPLWPPPPTTKPAAFPTGPLGTTLKGDK